VRDREPDAADHDIRFSPSILPPYMRRTKSIETLAPASARTTGAICCST
jgi:putative transposase